MSATYSKKSRTPLPDHVSQPTKEPISSQTIVARIGFAIVLFALFLAIFVLPWLFTGGR